jgi:hypothetical protein
MTVNDSQNDGWRLCIPPQHKDAHQPLNHTQAPDTCDLVNLAWCLAVCLVQMAELLHHCPSVYEMSCLIWQKKELVQGLATSTTLDWHIAL